jgi:hypothetical protein
MRARINTGLKGTKVAESEADQGKLEALTEPHKWVPCIKATHILTTPQVWTSSDLHGDPKVAMFKETISVTEDQFGDQHLAARNSRSTENKDRIHNEPLQGFSTAVEQLTHSAFPALQDNHVRRGPGKAFIDSIGEHSIKQQLLLGDIKALWLTLEVEIVKLRVGFSTGLCKTSDRVLWRSRLTPK